MNYLKKLFRLYVIITCIVYALILAVCVYCGEKIDLPTFLAAGPIIGAAVVFFWLYILDIGSVKTKGEIRDEKKREKILAQARSEGAKQAREFAQAQGINSAENPAQVCSVCHGCGTNAAGYVCPVCNGTGLCK